MPAATAGLSALMSAPPGLAMAPALPVPEQPHMDPARFVARHLDRGPRLKQRAVFDGARRAGRDLEVSLWALSLLLDLACCLRKLFGWLESVS